MGLRLFYEGEHWNAAWWIQSTGRDFSKKSRILSRLGAELELQVRQLRQLPIGQQSDQTILISQTSESKRTMPTLRFFLATITSAAAVVFIENIEGTQQ